MASNSDIRAIRSAIEKSGAQWIAAETSVSAMTAEQQKAMLGVPLPAGFSEEDVERDVERFRSQFLTAPASAFGAPAAKDWRNAGGNYVTPVKNQGGCGSCVAFGAVAAMESRLRVQRGNPGLAVDLSEAQLFYCHAKAEGRNCGNGWWPDKAMDALRDKGVTDETHYPYTAADQNCTLQSGWEGAVMRTKGYSNLTNNAGAMKQFIADNGPITACLYVYNDFFNYSGGVYKHVSGALAGGHCVAIIGYDDAAGCWICKNSWGTGWGESGFFKIAYGECGIGSYGGAFGVTEVLETGWLGNTKVVGMWTTNEVRNAWVYLDGGIGWRRVAYDNDNIFADMLTQLAAAKSSNRTVSVFQSDKVITEIYVG